MPFLADLRHGLRLVAKNPGFTTVAILSLAVGIGANTAVFSLVSAALQRPLPIDRPAEVALVYTSDFSGPSFGASSYPDYLDFRDETNAFRGLAAFGLFPATVVAGSYTERATGVYATGNYFELLGVRASIGRGLGASDDITPGGHPVVVLSDRFWQRVGGRREILDETISINGQPFVVIGIAPPEFAGVQPGGRADLWVPAAMLPQIRPGSNALTSRGSRGWLVIGRLAGGVGIEQAQAAFSVLAGQLAQTYPETWIDLKRLPRRLTIAPATRVSPGIRGAVAGFMTLLMAVVGLVLLIACGNVANLLLARAAARRREIAIRLSLGASRGRLVRQLLTESLLLSVFAGAAGLVLAFWIVNAIAAFQPPIPLPVPLDPAIDVRVLLFALALSIGTGLIFGLVPALQSTRADVVPDLKSDSALGVARRRLNVGHVLVAGQVALSLLVLVAAGLLVRTLQESQTVHLGFDPDNVAILNVDLAGAGQIAPERSLQTFEAIIDRVRLLPEVEHVSMAALVPLGLGRSRRGVTVEGYQFRQGEDTEQHFNVVTPDYFRTLRIPIVRGRPFAESDRTGALPVAMINETFARRFWPGQNPIGKRISVSGSKGPWLEIVGVTEDGHYVSMLDDTLPYFFLPLWQNPRSAAVVHLRTRTDPSAVIPLARSLIRETNPGVPVFDETLLDDVIGLGLLPHRLAASWLGIFGAIALLLAAIGLYGVLGHAVSLRHREIGVRMALGANPRAILALFLSQGMRVVAIGLVLGLAGAFGVTRLLSSLLYQVSPTDPLTFIATPAILLAVAFAATYLPARRAARLDPIKVLRQD